MALAAKEAEVRAAVATAFFELLGAQQQLSLAESALQLARGAATAAEKRLQAGKVAPPGLQAQSELLLARGRLAALCGQALQAVTQADGDAATLPEPPTEQRLAEWMADAPAVRLARLDIARQQALTDGERAKRVPDVTFTVGAKRDAERGRTQAVIGFSVPLPVNDRNQGGLLEALRREEQAREALTSATLKLQVDVAQAAARLALARDQAQLLRDDALPTAQTAYEAALKGYELGKFAFLDVLDAQRTLFQLRRQLLQSGAEAHRAAADLDRLLGRHLIQE